MILVIDSGATNSSWKFIRSDESSQLFKSTGFNLSTSHIEDLNFNQAPELAKKVEKIFFFGAGTGYPARDKILRERLKQFFPNNNFSYIGSDLNSAGIALSNNQKCVISILGTGSNCCVFENNQVIDSINNLGYILGDEGSGFLMGKMILHDYFYQNMDLDNAKKFESQYKLTREELITRVYHEGNKPNTYIASFSSFLINASEDYRTLIATKSLSLFFEQQINQFSKYKNSPHHFSGSISFHFQKIIKELCLKYELKIGNIIQNPIDSLSYSKLIQIKS